jgi:hypothetical protein
MSMCIYHGNCADGFGAAWVVRKALGEIDKQIDTDRANMEARDRATKA